MIPILEGTTICDLSRWNPETEANFVTAVSGGLVGVVCKFSQGGSEIDSRAITSMWEAKTAGVPLLGGYHFGDQSTDPESEAAHFLELMNQDFSNDLTDRELMLDLEVNGSSTMTVAQAEQFVTAIHAAIGRWPLLYMGRFGPDGAGSGLPSAVLSNCDLNLPGYGPYTDLAPHLPPGFRMPTSDTDRGGVVRFWQFTDGTNNGGPFPGLGTVDQWRAIGFSSLDALKARWGK